MRLIKLNVIPAKAGTHRGVIRARKLSAAKRVRVLRLAGLVLLAIAGAASARADEFSTLLSDLASSSFADKERAAIALGRLGDERAVAVLMALKDGRLIKAPDDRILVSDATRMTDPITGANIADVAVDTADRIRVNNRLRGAIEGALGELTLFSSDPTALLAHPLAPRGESADQRETGSAGLRRAREAERLKSD